MKSLHCHVTLFSPPTPRTSFSDGFIVYLSVTDVELKRLRDAFRRTCGLSCYMSQQCFFKEVLGDMVPLNISEVRPFWVRGVFHMLQGLWSLPVQGGNIWPVCVLGVWNAPLHVSASDNWLWWFSAEKSSCSEMLLYHDHKHLTDCSSVLICIIYI